MVGTRGLNGIKPEFQLGINSCNSGGFASTCTTCFASRQTAIDGGSVLYFYFPALIPIPHLSVVLPHLCDQPPTSSSSSSHSSEKGFQRRMPGAGLTEEYDAVIRSVRRIIRIPTPPKLHTHTHAHTSLVDTKASNQ